MTSILIKDLATELELFTEDPVERFITSGVSWQQYEQLLTQLGDSPWYRVTYLDEVLEIMSPSRRHDRDKTNIGMLLEAYFQETRTRVLGIGFNYLPHSSKKGRYRTG